MLLHTEEYSEQIDNFMERHEVKPGITGCAQVNGYRGQIKDLENMKAMVNEDIWYIQHWSLWMDMKTCVIILKEFFNYFMRS